MPLLFLRLLYYINTSLLLHLVAGYSASATLLITGGASLLLFGADLHFVWLHHIGKFAGKALSGYNVQSVDGFLACLFLGNNDELRNWEPIEVDGTFNTSSG